MTYKELLAKIDKVLEFYSEPNRQHNRVVIEGYKALRAVVELHKPDGDGNCHSCVTNLNWRKYPCWTIQAIEKGLK